MPRRPTCKPTAEPLSAHACMSCLRKTFSHQDGASLTSLTFVFLRLSPESTGMHTTWVALSCLVPVWVPNMCPPGWPRLKTRVEYQHRTKETVITVKVSRPHETITIAILGCSISVKNDLTDPASLCQLIKHLQEQSCRTVLKFNCLHFFVMLPHITVNMIPCRKIQTLHKPPLFN